MEWSLKEPMVTLLSSTGVRGVQSHANEEVMAGGRIWAGDIAWCFVWGRG